MTERRILSDYEKDDRESEAQVATLRQAFEEVAPPRTDYDRDDVASEAMARGFAWLREQQRLGKLSPPPPPPTRPQKSLVQMLLEIGCTDGRDGA